MRGEERHSRITVDHGDPDAVIQHLLQILDIIRPHEIPRRRKPRAHVPRIRARVINAHAQFLLRAFKVQKVDKVVRRRGVVVRVPDVVHAAAAVRVVRLLDHAAAQIRGLRARELAVGRAAVGGFAVLQLVAAAVGDGVGELHEGVDCVVDGVDAVGVVDGEFGVVRGLDFCGRGGLVGWAGDGDAR